MPDRDPQTTATVWLSAVGSALTESLPPPFSFILTIYQPDRPDEAVARRENRPAELVRDEVARGRMVIPANVVQVLRSLADSIERLPERAR